MGRIIMSWSKCTIKDAEATIDGTMPTTMTSLGLIKDKSTSIEATDGGELKALASGGVQIAYEQLEGGYQLTTRIIEPADSLYERFGLGKVATDELNVTTHVVQSERAIEVTPKNFGGKGIKAPNCIVKFKPGRSEEEGEFVDITYVILPVLNESFEVTQWYTRFTKKKTTDPANASSTETKGGKQ